MDDSIKSTVGALIGLLTSIIVLGIFYVIVSKSSNTANFITSFGGFFNNALQTVMTPLGSGSGFSLPNSFGSSAGDGLPLNTASFPNFASITGNAIQASSSTPNLSTYHPSF